MMDRIVARVELDGGWREMIDASRVAPEKNAADRDRPAAAQVSQTIGAKGIVAFHRVRQHPRCGSPVERPGAPVIGLTPNVKTAQLMAVVWGRACGGDPGRAFDDRAVNRAARVALTGGFAEHGGEIVVTAGIPFAHAGTTNALRVGDGEIGSGHAEPARPVCRSDLVGTPSISVSGRFVQRPSATRVRWEPAWSTSDYPQPLPCRLTPAPRRRLGSTAK